MLFLSKLRNNFLRPISYATRNYFYLPFPPGIGETEEQRQFEILRRLSKTSIDKVYQNLQKQSKGNTFKIRGKCEEDSFIIVYDPSEIKKVLETNDSCPIRPGFQTWLNWRKQRGHWFKNCKGLYLE